MKEADPLFIKRISLAQCVVVVRGDRRCFRISPTILWPCVTISNRSFKSYGHPNRSSHSLSLHTHPGVSGTRTNVRILTLRLYVQNNTTRHLFHLTIRQQYNNNQQIPLHNGRSTHLSRGIEWHLFLIGVSANRAETMTPLRAIDWRIDMESMACWGNRST